MYSLAGNKLLCNTSHLHGCAVVTVTRNGNSFSYLDLSLAIPYHKDLNLFLFFLQKLEFWNILTTVSWQLQSL